MRPPPLVSSLFLHRASSRASWTCPSCISTQAHSYSSAPRPAINRSLPRSLRKSPPPRAKQSPPFTTPPPASTSPPKSPLPPPAPRGRTRRLLFLLGTGGVLGLGAYIYRDELTHAYRGAQRTGRVVSTLAICINEFVPRLCDST